MPDPPIKPPNKGTKEEVNNIVTEIGKELWNILKIDDIPQTRFDKLSTFLIRKIAEKEYKTTIMEARISELERKIDILLPDLS